MFYTVAVKERRNANHVILSLLIFLQGGGGGGGQGTFCVGTYK